LQILRLATAEPAAAEFGSGTAVYTATEPTLVSVIAANKNDEDAFVYVYVVPPTTESTPTQWGIIAFNLPITAGNSYETFRFAMNENDALYVAGSSGVGYFVQGAGQGTA
jgi:hypothetical protein